MPKNLIISTDREFGEIFAASHDGEWYANYQDAIVPLGKAVQINHPVQIIYLDTDYDDFQSTVAHIAKISPRTKVQALVSGDTETITETRVDPTQLQLDYVRGELERVKNAHPPVASNAPIVVKVGDGLVRSWDAFVDSFQGRIVTALVASLVLVVFISVFGMASFAAIQIWDYFKSPSQRHDVTVPEEKP